MSYESDRERASAFDDGRIRQLREDAELHNVDFTRGQITSTDSGSFRVRLSPPIVDISFLLPGVPSVIEARTAAAAEGSLLSWLVAIQRAERRVVRMNNSRGMSPVDINRTPLSAEEIDRYMSRRRDANQITKLRIELGDAIAVKAKAKAAQAEAKALNERYGTTPAVACAVPADSHGAALNMPHKGNRK